jgi:hypothetical protein
MSILGNLKHGFHKIELGTKHTFQSIGKDMTGMGHVIGGLTMNPHEISKRAKDMKEGLK